MNIVIHFPAEHIEYIRNIQGLIRGTITRDDDTVFDRIASIEIKKDKYNMIICDIMSHFQNFTITKQNGKIVIFLR